jgi:hypothetical protein
VLSPRARQKAPASPPFSGPRLAHSPHKVPISRHFLTACGYANRHSRIARSSGASWPAVPLLELLDVTPAALAASLNPYGYTNRGQGRAGRYVTTNGIPGHWLSRWCVRTWGACVWPRKRFGRGGILIRTSTRPSYPALDIHLSRRNLGIQRASQHLHDPRSTPTCPVFCTCIGKPFCMR